MNLNPDAKVVLCFGDSNTHGGTPDDRRYPADVRWTGQLQQKLGDGFYVIEEGLGGRTTNLDHPLEEKPGRNGFLYFRPCLFSHAPLDIAIIMLGTNDLKNVYSRSAKEVTDALAEYCHFIEEFDSSIKLVLVAPVPFGVAEPIVFYDEAASTKSKQLTSAVERLAKERNTAFLDAAKYVTLGADKLHWDEPSQGKFATALEKVVRQVA